jgi:small-conductance mechanosensitive channel
MLALLAALNDLIGEVPRHWQIAVRIGVLVCAGTLGTVAIRSAVTAAFGGLDRQAAVVWRNLSTWTLYGLLSLLVASSLGINMSGFLVGGAVLGVLIAAISQASLSNFFSGLVLMLSRPYVVGTPVKVRGATNWGDWEGTVVDMGALFTTLLTPKGETVKLPNSGVMTSALVVGQRPLQAEVEVELDRVRDLGEIEESVRRQLAGERAAVEITPKSLDTGHDSRLTCRVQIRSRERIEPARLGEVLAEALGEPVGER